MDISQKLLIEMVMRQTTYSFEKAEQELFKNNNDYIKVIKNALGINKPEKKESNININQEIYKEIRGFMDIGSKNFLINQEKQKQQEKILSKIQQQNKLKKQKANLENIIEKEVNDNEDTIPEDTISNLVTS